MRQTAAVGTVDKHSRREVVKLGREMMTHENGVLKPFADRIGALAKIRRRLDENPGLNLLTAYLASDTGDWLVGPSGSILRKETFIETIVALPLDEFKRTCEANWLIVPKPDKAGVA